VIAFLVDQNFNEHIVDGMTRREAALEFTHVRDIGWLLIRRSWNGLRNMAWFY